MKKLGKALAQLPEVQAKAYQLSLKLTIIAYDPKQVRTISKQLQELLK